MELFNLLAKIALDSSEYEKGLGDAEKETKSFGGRIKSGLGTVVTGIGKGIVSLGKATLTGIATASSAALAIGKKSLEEYANYEQLVGGLETMFEDLSWDVEQNAKKAFKTAGLSANEYMETVMGFSAALNQSLKASEGNISRSADLADQAVIDMSDNANKMGTSMESIQNAYQGFAKGNFTMLDNLKLGYGGTKTEMERLLADAEKISGIKYDVSSFSDIVEAIHVVQTEMHISGTTAEEASKTISGSVNATKAAWQNLVVGISDDNADIDRLVNDLVDSIITTGDNLIPRIQKILDGVAKMISVAAEKLIPAVVQVITTNLPMLVDSAVSMVKTIVTTLTEPKTLSGLIDAAVEILLTLGNGIIEVLPKLVPAVLMIITSIVEKLSDPDTLNELVKSSMDMVGEIATGLIDNIPELLKAAWELAKALAEALLEYDWWGLAKKIFSSIKNALKNIFTRESGGNEESTEQPHGRHASGLKYVPFDEYHAVLHKGERVLTATEAKEYPYESFKTITPANNEESGKSVEIMSKMLDEMQAMRRDMYEIILTALRTNSDDFDASEKDIVRMVKKYAFA